MPSDTPPQIRCDLEALPTGGQLARVTIDHEARINSLNSALILQLAAVCGRLSGDDDLRCVVLTGAGDRAFIGGADIREMASLDPSSARGFISRLHDACASIRAIPVPVIARIQGYCLGAGLEIAASCDLRVAAHGATFGMPEVHVGIPSVIEAALLPRLVGAGTARELVFTGASLTAADAWRCGLVDKVVAVADLDVVTLEWVQAIASAGPRAMRLQKQLVRLWDTVPLDDAIARSMQTFAEAYETDEPRRLMQAFLDRKL
ncbi:MAG: enoyl-CoA hydratase [Acidobacteria bacterium]|nr:enoyl-CoA hydratase [Acidobacteriota bacterium]